MSKVLVVGGAGYVGSHMAKLLLERGHSAFVLDNLSRGHRDAVGKAPLIEADLLDPAAIERAFAGRGLDVVMHYAAFCYVGESVEKPAEYYRNNVVGTLNLLDAMRRARVDNLVFSSTCATYGEPLKLPMDEAHPQRPINPYGATKLAAERALADYAAAYGLNSVSLRYFNAAGCDPGGLIGESHHPETHLIPLVLRECRRVRDGGDPGQSRLAVNGNDYPTTDGTCVRDYVHVDDLAQAHLAAMEAMIAGKLKGAHAFNLGTGTGFSVLQVIESARRVTGVPIRYRVNARRPGDPAALVADAGMASRVLGWSPRYRDIDGIVATAWRWFDAGRDLPKAG